MGYTLEQFYELDKAVIKKGRQDAKGINFGYIYGMFAKSYVPYAKTQYGLDVTIQEAEAFRARFFNKYRHLIAWHKTREQQVHREKQVRSVFGRVRHLPQIDSTDFMTEVEAVRQAINSPVQSAGSDLGVMTLARMFQELDIHYIYPRQFIHDAIYCYVPLKYMAWASLALKWYMESNPIYEWFNFDFSVPIVADPEVGLNQGSLIEVTAPCVDVREIDYSDLDYLETYKDDLAEKGCIIPAQEIPPNMGMKFIPRRRR